MDQAKTALDKFARDLDKYPMLGKLETQTGVPKLYLTAGGAALLVIVVFFGFGAGLLCNLVGFVWPAYKSFKAIESPETGDDTQWLIYWVVYSLFAVVEVFDGILAMIPFYFAFKLGFLVWLMAPSTQGATFLYHHFIGPFLKQHESRIDGAISEAKAQSGSIVAEATSAAAELSTKAVQKGMEYKAQQAVAAATASATATSSE